MELMNIVARLTDSQPPSKLRLRCGWCADKQVLDGRGPILPGELVSDGLCDVCQARLHAEMDASEARKAA